ncbi:MAG: arginine--tRNA ligase [Patescibacteria group bacterium]
MTIREEIKSAVAKAVADKGDSIEFTVEVPENANYGDYATNVALILVPRYDSGQSPMEIANEIISKLEIQNSKFIDKVEVVNGFINFYLKPEFIQGQVKEILKQNKKYGSNKIGKGKTVIIDYSSPNIAKKMHVGHLRSTIIGAAIYNVYKFLGYKVVGDNHLGDWGKQFGIMLAGISKYKYDPKKMNTQDMLDVYVKFNNEMKNDLTLDEWARNEFKDLENNFREYNNHSRKEKYNTENIKTWETLREKSLEEFEKIYNMLGIKFDEYNGESHYESVFGEVVKDCETLNLDGKDEKYFLSNGAYLINLDEFGLDPLLIKKSDGATLYATRELATIKERAKDSPEKIIYVVGNEQSLHFQQSFQAAELLNYISKDKLIHVKFGLILDENHKKLATRTGRFIGAEDLINQIIELAEKIIKEKNPSLSEKERKNVAKAVGIGALKYNDLYQNRQSDIVFNWNRMLSFDGNSAPYILYTYVRLQSILGKTKFAGSFKSEFLKENEELNVIKELIKFPDVVEDSAESFQMNNLANYLYDLASLANNFYEKFNILKVDHDTRGARLALIKAVTIVLKNGLNLLGINTIEKM